MITISDPAIVTEELKDIVISVLGVLVLLFGGGFIFIYRWSVSGQLKSYETKFNETLAAINDSIKMLSQQFESHARDDREAHAQISVLTERLTNLSGQVQKLNDFKHNHCEPAVRYVHMLQLEKPWERRQR